MTSNEDHTQEAALSAATPSPAEPKRVVDTESPARQARGWVKPYLKTMIALLPTVNGTLLVVQSALEAEPLHAVIPGWVYLFVNGGIVIGAALVRVSVILVANPLIHRWLDTDIQEEGPPVSAGTEDIER